jgi:hypothetical protein
MKKLTLLLALCMFQIAATAQQNFSCSYGARAACLGFNEKVVNSNSVCFSEFTCDFKGFTCKSKFDDVVAQHDSLVRKHNDLIRSHRDLADTAREIADRRKFLADDHESLIAKFRTLASDYETQAGELIAANQRISELESTIRQIRIRHESAQPRKK